MNTEMVSKIQRMLQANQEKLGTMTRTLYSKLVGVRVRDTIVVCKPNTKDANRVGKVLTTRTFQNGDNCVLLAMDAITKNGFYAGKPVVEHVNTFWAKIEDVEVYGGNEPSGLWLQMLARTMFHLEPVQRLFLLQLEEQRLNIEAQPEMHRAIEEVCTFRFGLDSGPKRQPPLDFMQDKVRDLFMQAMCPISSIEELLLVNDPNYRTPLAERKEKTVIVEEESPLPLSFNEKSMRATNLFALMQEYCGTPAPQTPAKEKNANSDSVPVPRKPRKPNKTPGSISVIEDD